MKNHRQWFSLSISRVCPQCTSSFSQLLKLQHWITISIDKMSTETLLGGGGHPKGHYVSGWTLRYALARDRCALRHTRWQGWQTSPWGHRRETGTVKWGVNRSTRGKSSLAWALGCQDHFPQPSRINNGPQIRFTLWRLRLSVFTVFPVFMWGSTISNALLLCGKTQTKYQLNFKLQF